jgi:subtilisin-like proprotein convertase family protein
MFRGRHPKLFGIFVALALLAAPLVWLAQPASASGTFSNTSSIGLVDPSPASHAAASTYPSNITVSGQTGTISSLTVTLSGVDYRYDQDLAVLLVGPRGGSLSLFTSVGWNDQSAASSGLDVTLSDSGTTIPYDDSTFPTSGSITMQPADFTSKLPSAFSYYDQFPSPAPSTIGQAAPTSTQTLGSEFDGTNPNGTWSLYVTTNAEGDGSGSIASGWSLNITTAATLASTTTGLLSTQNPSFTSSPNNSTTLTATVMSSGSPVTSGTVDFTDGGTTISGCGAASLSVSGQATCTTSFTTEGDHNLEAIYSGTTSFVTSQGTLTQEVDNHTVVSGNNYANTGALNIPNSTGTPGLASVYPSHVYVSGLSGSVTDVEVSLNDINYPFAQDLDIMLVGPQGGLEIVLSGVGSSTGTTSATGLTLNIDDSSTTALGESAVLPTNTTVLTKPVDYTGVDSDAFPAPAPSGPYGQPAPRGSNTLGGKFDGTNPNGTWSLYVVTDGAGDGAGEITGGWSLTITTGSEALTSTTVSSSVNPSFTSAPSQAVTFTATVTSGSPATAVTTGTVEFTANGTTISGCGAATLNASGQATCSTSFSTEADLAIEALYSGTASFAVSSGSISQEVDNHTTVVAPNQFANPGAITLNNPTSSTPTPEQATPYPSNIYVSNLGPVSGLTVTLKGITYPFSSDLNFLLVGPTGKSIVLLSNVGPSIPPDSASNVTVTFSDSGSTIPQNVPLDAPGSSVTAKPVDYTGTDTDSFPAPAPSGPYGTPAPKGSATLGGTFDGTNPDGTWSLYAVTVGDGDGTGSIAGDWSTDFTVASQTISFSSTNPTTAVAGISYQASATATSTLPVAYSIDGTSTPGACSVDSTGKVSFLATGTCILDANQSGDGNWSAAPQVSQTINVVAPPGSPTALTATASDSEVTLNWTAPANIGGSPVTSYNIYQGTSSGGETLLHSTGTTSTTFTSTGLTNGTTYYFKVTAVNSVGEGPFSNEVFATPAVVPGAPTTLTAAGGSAQVALAWGPPTSTGGDPVLGYRIYQGTSSGTETLLTSTSTTATIFTSTALTNGTTYYFEVTALTLAGEGPVSNEASATPATVPGAPTALTATFGNAQVALSWTAPTSNGGSAITTYKVYEGTSSGGETFLTNASGTTYTATGLTNGTTYFFEVTAVNGVGEGPVSNEASATPATVPGAPTALTATFGNAQVALSWTAPTSNGGDPIISYNIYEGTSSGGETLLQSTGSTATTYTATGLTNGTTYFFEVTAVTLAGEGPVSNEASATPATLPGAPTALTATFGNTQVALSWTAPTSNGGDPIISYNIYEGTSSGGETLLQSTGSTATTYTSTGLTNGTTYYFEVTAVTLVGEGPISNEASATPATLPGAPTGLSATGENTQVALTWSAPANNGGPAVTSYNVYEGTSSGGETFLTNVSGTSSTATGLTNGTKYFFEVTAVNGVGEGPVSNEASAVPASVPGAPTGLGATRGDGQVMLTWTAPVNDGGAAITSYNVYKGTSSGGESLLTSASGTSYTATGLTNGTTYFFVVTAVNSAGESLVSNEASATPATLPGAPTDLNAGAGNGSVFLTWAPPANNGGSAVTSYNIYQGTSSGGETLLTNVTGTSFTATGLTNGTTYYFEVTAVNGVGEGPVSNQASAMPAVPPPPPPPTTTTTTTTTPLPPPQGYLMVSRNGQVYSFGSSASYGSVNGHINDIVGLAVTADGAGYWVAGADGRVFRFGDARNLAPVHGANKKLDQIVGIAPTPSGAGYWLAGSNGQVYAFGNAHDYGSVHSSRKNVDQIVGIAATADGRGYWLVGSDGTVYPFGDASNFGSPSSRNVRAQDIVGITATADGAGYWLVGSDGRVFAFGDAHNFGSAASGRRGQDNVVGITRTADGQGYWVVKSNGSVSNFGDAKPEGSLPGRGVSTHSIVGIAP